MDEILAGVCVAIAMIAILRTSAKRYAHKLYENAWLYLAIFVFICAFASVFFAYSLWMILITAAYMAAFVGYKIRRHKKLSRQQRQNSNHNPNVMRYQKWGLILGVTFVSMALLDYFLFSHLY